MEYKYLEISKNIFNNIFQKNFKEKGVGMIVCLLNKYELRTIGVDL
jgi:hypothetical protein